MADKVILAEDNQAMRDALAEVLTKERGFEVVAVADGAAAEAAAKEGAALLILDLLLPKKQGLAVLESLKAAGTVIPTVVITGVFKAPAQAKDAKEKLGVKEYLVKPFEAEQFLASVDAAMGRGSKSAQSQQNQAPVVPAEPMPEAGSTADFPVGLLMFRAHNEKLNGILELAGQGGERARLFFYRGSLVMAQSNKDGRHVGAELVKMGILSAETLKLAMDDVQKSSVGLAKALATLELVDEVKLKEAYKALIPGIAADLVAMVGTFKWVTNDTFAKLIPAVPLPVLPSLMEGMKNASRENIAKLLEKRRPARLLRGPMFDRFNPGIETALGAEASRSINGRARLGQIVEAAPTPEGKAQRMAQIFALLCTQSALVNMEDAAAVSPGMEPMAAPPPRPAEPPRSVSSPGMPAAPPPRTPTQVPEPPRPAAPPAPAAASPLPGSSPRPSPVQPASPQGPPPPRAGHAAAPAGPAKLPPGLSPEHTAVLQEVDVRFTSMTNATHYEILGVTDKDDLGTLKKAYFALAGKFHADKFSGVELGEFRSRLDAVFARISEAHDVLSKPEKRAEYDVGLKMKAAGSTMDVAAIFEAESQFTKAETVMQRGDMATAKKLLDRALELDPKDHYRIWQVYVAYRAAGAPKDQAAGVIQQLEALGKKTAEPRLNEFLGQVAKCAEDWNGAKKYFRRMKEDPNGNKQLADRELAALDKKIADTTAAAAKGGGLLGKFFKS